MGSPRSAWIDAAERALKKLHAHPFVDPEHTANRGRYLFTEPVLERFPYLRESYLKVISKPMDLRTIGERLAATRALLTGHRIPGAAPPAAAFADARAFARDVSLVFANAHDYNKASAVKPAGVAAGGEGGSALAAIMGTADEDLADEYVVVSRIAGQHFERLALRMLVAAPQRTSG